MIPTPKQKARQLIDKFYYLQYESPDMLYDERLAKRSVMIMLDVILTLDVWDNHHDAVYGKLYWEKVKKKISKKNIKKADCS